MEQYGDKHIPLYKRVEHHILNTIEEGHLVPGDLIPSEPQLAEQLNVSQGTVKKAIENLVNEKRLFRHQGKGTYVSRIDFNNSLFRFFSYGDETGKGARIRKTVQSRELKQGPAAICQTLGKPADSELLYIRRFGYIQEEPILVEHCWWCPDVVPGLEQDSVHIPDLMYALVVEKYGVPVVRAEETLTAEIADPATASMLGIAENSPVVVLIRHAYTRNNKMIEYRKTVGRADKFSYKTEIR
ncbi:GntR family transcriptional regulator [Marinobacterium rhizophilum]|uniref:GntR family transcriptional regulator n=1 Tax=Marinobacterium rhizophilum TaxID=420402 RepID=A0ABY5HJV1_9GAMM|nr:GntR family transcriptional regulator [Marinobacterium rhizophilum]UTW11554.1 GntR family transcriptional regulator [Marinobacterium rhizophilum]